MSRKSLGFTGEYLSGSDRYRLRVLQFGSEFTLTMSEDEAMDLATVAIGLVSYPKKQAETRETIEELRPEFQANESAT